MNVQRFALDLVSCVEHMVLFAEFLCRGESRALGVAVQHTYTYEFFKDFTAPIVALIGVTVTGTMAGIGLRSFAKFKREKIEERRIEVAIDALTIAYEAKFVFETIRARVISRHEYEDATYEPTGSPVSFPMKLKEGQQGAYAVLQRIGAQESFFERVASIEPKFMAVFGADTEGIFALLYSARTQIAAAADTLLDIGGIESEDDERIREERRELRSVIYKGPTETKDKDRVGDMISEFRKRIEAVCRPVVDQQYGKRT